MRIAIISPVHRSGISTLAAILGYSLTWTQKRSTTLSYIGHSDIPAYLGLQDLAEDKTRSISQLVKLVHARALTPEQTYDYFIPLIKDLYLLHTDSEVITLAEKAETVTTLFDVIPTDYVICDINGEIYDDSTQLLLNSADIIVIAFEPYGTQIQQLKNLIQNGNLPKDKHYIYVCNKYEEIVYPVRDLSKEIGVAHLYMCRLHYNPWIMTLCKKGELNTLIPLIMEKDPRLLSLHNDIRELMQLIMSLSRSKIRWET